MTKYIKYFWAALLIILNSPRSIYFKFWHDSQTFRLFSTFGLVFFVLESLLEIARQLSLEEFATLSLKNKSHVRIDHFRYIKIHTWLRGLGERNKQKKMYYSLLSLQMIPFVLFPQTSPPSMNFNISELVCYDISNVCYWVSVASNYILGLFWGEMLTQFPA